MQPALRPVIHARLGSRSMPSTTSPAAVNAIASPPIPQQQSITSAPEPSTLRIRAAFHAATASLDACSTPCVSHHNSANRAHFPRAFRRPCANSSAAATRSASNRFRSRAIAAASRESTNAAAAMTPSAPPPSASSRCHTETSRQSAISGI